MESNPSDDGLSSGRLTPARASMSAGQIELLKTARDNRGSLSDFPVRLCASAASLVAAGLLVVDVVGFSLTPNGVVRLAEIEELESITHAPPA